MSALTGYLGSMTKQTVTIFVQYARFSVFFPGAGCLAFLLGTLLGGCATTHYRESADKEVYGIVTEKSPDVPGMPPGFTIDQDSAWDPLDGLEQVTEKDPALGENDEVGAHIVPLERALAIAVRRNRNYQAQRESLYLQALSLTLDRYDYAPIFSGLLSGGYNRTTRDVTRPTDFSAALGGANAIIDQFESLTGTPATLLNDYAGLVAAAGTLAGADGVRTEVRNERSLSGQTRFGTSVLLKGGGRFAVNLTSNFLRFLTGDDRVATSSALVASFTQPILRGAGRKIAAERLTQAERDVLYSLRSFTRFRKTFTVSICSQYYGVLQARDRLTNNYNSYLRFQENLKLQRALAAEGRKSQSDLGLLEQAELNAKNSWINSLQSYKASLDRFKIQLGLSTDAAIILDMAELDRLHQDGLRQFNVSPEDAAKVALATRLDYYNARDRTIDAKRRVMVAADALKPGLDLVLTGNAGSTGTDNFQEIDFQRGRWSAGLDLDLPFDQKAKRNNYRAALIGLERARREESLAEDNVKLDVREAWRDLDRARLNYEVARVSLRLGERRVEEQELLAELGRATTRDLVDAQDDLTSARNNLTDELINHTIARLTFWQDMGILFIKEDGQWEEVTDAITP